MLACHFTSISQSIIDGYARTTYGESGVRIPPARPLSTDYGTTCPHGNRWRYGSDEQAAATFDPLLHQANAALELISRWEMLQEKRRAELDLHAGL